ncbi:fimbria/pilus outer membrane usher protein [Pseudomonas citrulli]|uniref:Fimbria/pilus outer membrane usher protein n=1 Tax=Pseudomonas citrulli TaxID=3064347 RepID=A0ABT9BUP9_9PSED|nr:fimbria/pilus outer membrane usher protein [Pseudomonas sp. K18]MDO7895690.1 fimbria/pilus outer membrane usher protein [Pseudomonas sp. K18]
MSERIHAALYPGLRSGVRRCVGIGMGSRTWTHKWALSAAICCGVGSQVFAQAHAQADRSFAQFDTSILSSRGIDPGVSDYFRTAPRFHEGSRVVSLRVNGNPMGLTEARFDRDGELCFTRSLLEKAGVQVPAAITDPGGGEGEACHDFLGRFPTTVVSLLPNREEVALVVPSEALREPEFNEGAFSQGGLAGLLNYDVLGLDSQSRSGGGNRYLSVATEAGVNLGDWIVRSRQLYTSINGVQDSEHLYAYAQRDVRALQSTFQAGQLSSNSPVFGGVQFSGLQLFPDGVKRGDGARGPMVEGLALSQSRVEVRQSGALIYTTLVPEGPFTLGNLPLLNGTSDLEVSVIEENGAEQRFVVPAASLRGMAPAQAGYYLSLGQARGSGERDGEQPLLAMGSATWGIGRSSALSSGLVGAQNYQAAGLGLDTRPLANLAVGVRGNVSHDKASGQSGGRSSLSLGTSLAADLDLSFSVTRQTLGYREVSQIHYVDKELDREDFYASRFKSQYTAGLGWSDPALGGFSVGYTQSSQFDNQTYARLYGSWNRSFKHANVGAYVDSAMGTSSAYDEGVSVRLQVSVPLGRDRRARSSLTHQGSRSTLAAAYSERVNDALNYELGHERGLNHPQSLTRANVNALPRFAQVGLGASQDRSSTQYNGYLRGGVVAHGQGLTFSPYRVQETFGIASVEGVPGARISTPQGPVWTDSQGRAVIASLPAYNNSRVELDTRSLPKRVDIQNGTQVLSAGRGSFNAVDFSVLNVRRLLLQARDESGEALPQGVSVLTANDDFLTSVAGEGMIFLSDINGQQALKVALSGARTCQLQFELMENNDEDLPYETASAVCRDFPADEAMASADEPGLPGPATGEPSEG